MYNVYSNVFLGHTSNKYSKVKTLFRYFLGSYFRGLNWDNWSYKQDLQVTVLRLAVWVERMLVLIVRWS